MGFTKSMPVVTSSMNKVRGGFYQARACFSHAIRTPLLCPCSVVCSLSLSEKQTFLIDPMLKSRT